jgi:hypothetical protein
MEKELESNTKFEFFKKETKDELPPVLKRYLISRIALTVLLTFTSMGQYASID